MSLTHWLHQGEARLRTGPHPDRARPDSELLLLHLLQRDRAYLLTHLDEILTAEGAVRYYALVDRRLAGEPIQYILGETEFYGLPFQVTRDVLIPRPETEHLVEQAIALAGRFPQPRIVDIGTGSGAISVSLAHKLPQAQLTAIDISPAALAIAEKNAKLNEVPIRFLCGDLLAPVAAESFEIVVSNPPYVPAADRDSLAVEVREYEPGLALFAGDEGLEIYRRLIPEAFAVLVPGGFLALEIGFGQSPAIADLLAAYGFRQIEFVPDLQGIPRVACAQRP
jgi:release factor glutamine methyltransferase